MKPQHRTVLVIVFLAAVMFLTGCTDIGSGSVSIEETRLDTEQEWVFPVYTFEDETINDHLPNEIEVTFSDGTTETTEILWVAPGFDHAVPGEYLFIATFRAGGNIGSEEITVVLEHESDN